MSDDELWPLPNSWQWTTFETVAEVSSDLRDPTATPEAIHIAPNHIESASGRLLSRGTVAGDGVTSPKHAFHPGQVLYSKIRPYLAKAVLVDFEGLCSADMYPVSVRPGLMESRYLHRWLVSPAFTATASKSQGRTVLPKINRKALYKKPVPLAPLPEQKRIADKLDALLVRVNACSERLDRVPGILKRFRQSVLAAAIRYRRFGDELLLLELANAASASAGKPTGTKGGKSNKSAPAHVAESASSKPGGSDRSYADWLPLLPPHLIELVASLEGHILSLGDDVQRKELKLYVAFKRLKNFATVVPQKNRLLLYLHLDPAKVVPMPPNGQDVGQKGHWGTGDLELSLASQADLDTAKPLILMAYEGRAPNVAAGATNSSGPAGVGA